MLYFSDNEIKGVTPPKRFTFPFFYQPHKLSEIAAEKLQNYLQSQTDIIHNFGLGDAAEGPVIGKMFGVLVVEDSYGRLGYLWAFSGKLGGTNLHKKFVPPVFDMLTENSFFLKEEETLNALNAKIEEIENSSHYQKLMADIKSFTEKSVKETDLLKKFLRKNKLQRNAIRQAQKPVLETTAFAALDEELIKESLADKRRLKALTEQWQHILATHKEALGTLDEVLNGLRKERKEKSASLQNQLFSQYTFLNKNGQHKSLKDIFSATAFGRPPAAAGECATPKLLQYAFIYNLKPLAMAEFWWGASPKSEIRKHRQFYPACTGKCQPILKHMLQDIETDENPLLINLGESKKLEIVFEDEYLIVVNKPEELLSVPGINIQDSVYTRLKNILVTTDPIIVHRLDMATSGLLVIAKTKEAHKHLQRQFLKRTVDKRYTALLSGIVTEDEGEINLPLRGDLDDRPRQMVCYEYGKKAITKWKVITRFESATKVHFWPLTGRTHQLRMHAAHLDGLNTPIIGDDLYGTAANRLHLHAGYLEFTHPKTKERLSFEVKEPF
ncbi:RluA family pseudouridine synthase [Flavobacterium rhizosphaerae]|uniref:Pseudouridine synthase n=1 Tax=Flavobacterium rhizosphaerae TaxID=3163298 RepID=A0ABW8YY90_9FLAO